jgi:hypothetical protein
MLNIFTIVLNGQPWLTEVAASLLSYPGDWRWSVVHGVADPVGDTDWCKTIAAPEDDGTLDLIESLALSDKRISLTRRPRWPGKTSMVNTALSVFDEPGVLMQMDCDEIWTPAQLRIIATLFDRTDAHAAMFLCRYWVGPRRYLCTPGAWGNNPEYEWIRAWRWQPGQRFETHEPPVLAGCARYLTPAATSQLGLVFDHYAYATRQQVEFKERYYGYEGAVEAWDRLQAMRGPVDLRGVLPWVRGSVVSYEA